MAIVDLHILNHADFGASFRPDFEDPGISKFYAAIESIRSNDPDHTLLLDAGDNFKNKHWDDSVQEGIIRLKTDVYNYGNHDFDWGKQHLEEHTAYLKDKVKVVCANVIDKETNDYVKGAKPYVVFEKGGIKYGVLGLITEYTPYMVTAKYFKPYKVISAVECARKFIPIMRKEGAEIIICLTHFPFYFTDTDESGELIEVLDKIADLKPDVMIGGHIPGDYGRIYKDCAVNKGGFAGRSLPHITLSFDTDTRKVVDKKAEVIDVYNNEFDINPEMEKWMHSIIDPHDYYFNEPIAEAIEDIPSRLDFESPLGNLYADMLMDKYHTDFVYFNNTSMGHLLNKGKLCRCDVENISGFDDPLYIGEYTGKQIFELFERVHDPEVFGNNGNISFSGLIVKMDHTKPKNQKVVYIKTSDGKDIDLNKKYSVATSEYMRYGGNGTYPVADQIKWEETGDRTFDVLINYLIKYKEIKCPELGRYPFIGKPENDNSPW